MPIWAAPHSCLACSVVVSTSEAGAHRAIPSVEKAKSWSKRILALVIGFSAPGPVLVVPVFERIVIDPPTRFFFRTLVGLKLAFRSWALAARLIRAV